MHYIEMSMSPVRRAFRFISLALAALQLVVTAGAPIYEALTVVPQIGSSASVASPDSEKSAPAHDPGTCPACQTLKAFARLPEAPRILLPSAETGAPRGPTVDAAPQQTSRQGFLSRAPPTLLG